MNANLQPSHSPKPPSHWSRRLLWPLAALVLLIVFAMYTQPEFMMQVANEVWACF